MVIGIFNILTAAKKEERLMQEKSSRAIAIAVSQTVPKALGENVGAIVAGSQWIVKLDETFIRIPTPQRKLCKDSRYRI